MLKRIIFLIFCIISICTNIQAQSVEWEALSFGTTFGYPKDALGNKVGVYGILATEVRINLYDKSISPGIQFGLSGWNRSDDEGYEPLHQRSLMLMAVTDYNFTKIHPKIVPFAGLGLGMSVLESDYSSEYGDAWNASHLLFSPRIGAEFFKRVRFTFEYRYQGNYSNFFAARLGFVIGS